MRISVSVLLSAVLLAAPAAASTRPADPGALCAEQLRQQAPRFDTLAVALSLTPKQKPVFEHWKQVMLGIARARGCTPLQMDYSLPTLKRIALEETILSLALTSIDKEKAALTALYGILSPAQRAMFDRPQMPGKAHVMGKN